MAKTPASLMEQAQQLIKEAKALEKEYSTKIGDGVVRLYKAGKITDKPVIEMIEKLFGKPGKNNDNQNILESKTTATTVQNSLDDEA